MHALITKIGKLMRKQALGEIWNNFDARQLALSFNWKNVPIL